MLTMRYITGWQAPADLGWTASQQQQPLTAHSLSSSPLAGGGQLPGVALLGVGDQARLPHPLKGGQVQPVGMHLG